MSAGLDRLKAGDFNDMYQEGLPDNIKVVTLSKRGEAVTYRFKVRDLNGPEEEVLEDQVIKRTAAGAMVDKAALFRRLL